jgi:hypothetical protein
MLQKPFEGGNYSREKTVCRNTVFTLLKPMIKTQTHFETLNVVQHLIKTFDNQFYTAALSLCRIFVQIL